MNNPIKTAQKLKAGCKTEESCGSSICDGEYLCDECLATLTAKKEEWQNEIEFLQERIVYLPCDDYGEYHKEKKIIESRIQNLKKAVEIGFNIVSLLDECNLNITKLSFH